jgi:uncharacterized phiE125 gp8 family phage protein
MPQSNEMTSRLITNLSPDAVTLADFKEFIKWDADDATENATMMACLTAATEEAESFTRRVCIRGTWRTFIECFPYCLKLDVHPIVISSIVVKYYDVNNALQTLASSEYFVKDNGTDEHVEIIFDGTMPVFYDRWEPIYLEYTAGYEFGHLPDRIKVGILEKAANDFENRTSEQAGSLTEKHFNYQQSWYRYKMMG